MNNNEATDLFKKLDKYIYENIKYGNQSEHSKLGIKFLLIEISELQKRVKKLENKNTIFK